VGVRCCHNHLNLKRKRMTSKALGVAAATSLLLAGPAAAFVSPTGLARLAYPPSTAVSLSAARPASRAQTRRPSALSLRAQDSR